jgi:hypothetical protein
MTKLFDEDNRKYLILNAKTKHVELLADLLQDELSIQVMAFLQLEGSNAEKHRSIMESIYMFNTMKSMLAEMKMRLIDLKVNEYKFVIQKSFGILFKALITETVRDGMSTVTKKYWQLDGQDLTVAVENAFLKEYNEAELTEYLKEAVKKNKTAKEAASEVSDINVFGKTGLA